MIVGFLPGKAPPEPLQSGGRYKFLSCGSEYTVELKETIVKLEGGKRKRSTDYWATCVFSEVKEIPGNPFIIKKDHWEHLIRIGYLVACY